VGRINTEELKEFSEDRRAESMTTSSLLISDVQDLDEPDCDYRTNIFRPASRWITEELNARKYEQIMAAIKKTIGIGETEGHFVGALFEHLVHQLLVPSVPEMRLIPVLPNLPEFCCRRILPRQPPDTTAMAAEPTTTISFPIEVNNNGWPLCHTFSDIKEISAGAPGSYWRPLISNFPTIDGIVMAHPNATNHPLLYSSLLQMAVGTKTQIKLGGLMKVLNAIFPQRWVQGDPIRIVSFYWLVPSSIFLRPTSFTFALPITSRSVPVDIRTSGYDIQQYVLGVDLGVSKPLLYSDLSHSLLHPFDSNINFHLCWLLQFHFDEAKQKKGAKREGFDVKASAVKKPKVAAKAKAKEDHKGIINGSGTYHRFR
jgi:hypothetical protein